MVTETAGQHCLRFTLPKLYLVSSLNYMYFTATFFYFNYFVFHFLWFLELSEELQQLQEMARKFSHEEIVPVAAEYDKTGEVKREFMYFTLYIVHVVCLLLPSFLFFKQKCLFFSIPGKSSRRHILSDY